MLVIYDIKTDERRPVTQHDIDVWMRCEAAFGVLRTHLAKVGQPEIAAIAIDVAQGKISTIEGTRRMREHHERGA